MKRTLLAVVVWLGLGGAALAQPYGISSIPYLLCSSAAYGNVAASTQSSQFPMLYGGKFLKMTIQNAGGGSCTTAPTFQAVDGTNAIGSAQAASTTAQAVGTVTTVTFNPGSTFAAGDVIGVQQTGTPGTCTTAIFTVCLQVLSP